MAVRGCLKEVRFEFIDLSEKTNHHLFKVKTSFTTFSCLLHGFLHRSSDPLSLTSRVCSTFTVPGCLGHALPGTVFPLGLEVFLTKITYCFSNSALAGHRGDCSNEVIIPVCLWAVASTKKGMLGSSLVTFHNRCLCQC